MKKNKKHFEVLVIEDETDSLNLVMRSLPDNCSVIPQENWFPNLCKNGVNGELVLESGEIIQFKKYVGDIITKHNLALRAIVCDLNLGSEPKGGEKCIKWIRGNNEIELEDEYLKHIPIIIYTKATKTTDEQKIAAFEAGANAILFKDDAKITGMKKDEKMESCLKKNIEIFDCLCQHYINHKPYKIALSFTGYNKSEPHREYIEEIANQLYGYYTKDRVFYDMDKLDDGTTPGLKMNHYESIYREECDYIIVFVSKDYNTIDNPWTQREWVGIKDYYEKSPTNVIFVVIEDGVSSLNFKNNLSLSDVPIWINAAKSRKSFYEVLSGQSLMQRGMMEKMVYYNSTMKDYLWKCYEAYKEECEKIAHKVISPIKGHISKVDAGEK